MAAYIGCKKDELALMHNATEAMSTVAAGVDLNTGDEVVMMDQEHPSGPIGLAHAPGAAWHHGARSEDPAAAEEPGTARGPAGV